MSSEFSTFKAARKHHFLVFFTKLLHSPTSSCLVPVEKRKNYAHGRGGPAKDYCMERCVSCSRWCRDAVGHYTLGSGTRGVICEFAHDFTVAVMTRCTFVLVGQTCFLNGAGEMSVNHMLVLAPQQHQFINWGQNSECCPLGFYTSVNLKETLASVNIFN